MENFFNNSEAVNRVLNLLAPFAAELRNEINAGLSNYRSVIQTSLESAFSPYANNGKGGIGQSLNTSVQSAIVSALSYLPTEFLVQFKDDFCVASVDRFRG